MVQLDLAAAQQLCALLAGFKDRRGLSYEKLGELASCSRGTAENYITKPAHTRGEEILHSLLTALGVTDDERAEALRLHRLSRPETPAPATVGWRAAAAEADCTVWELDEFTPAEATVHPAIRRGPIPIGGQNMIMAPPAYVPRDHDTPLHADIAAAARGELRALVVLCGGPSTGKTRSLFEAVHALGSGWAVVRPRSAAALRGLVTSGLLRRRRCVLWLNELQIFLGPNGTGLSLDVLRDLFAFAGNHIDGKNRSSRPLVIVATLWPEKLRDATEPDDQFSDNRDLLVRSNRWVYRHDIPRDFSARERDRARAVAASTSDDRLGVALENPDRVGFAQTLAGGHELLQHYLTAPNPMDQLLIDAAGDARRLGHTSPMTASLLHAIAAAHWREERGQASLRPGWFDSAIVHATQPLRSTQGVQALIPLDDTEPHDARTEATYELADYLEQHLSRTRRIHPVTDAVWVALRKHYTSTHDALNIARAAIDRGRSEHGEALYRTVSTPKALGLWAQLLGSLPGRDAEAEKAYRDAIAAGDRAALLSFSNWTARQPGLEAEALQAHLDAVAAQLTLGLLGVPGQLAMLAGREAEVEQVYRGAIAAGDPAALPMFVTWLGTQPGREAEIEQIYRDAINAGRSAEMLSFAEWLATQRGREAEIEQVYRGAIAAGQPAARLSFAGWLATQRGREVEVEQVYRAVVAADDHLAADAQLSFANWLATQPGREAETEQVYRDANATGDPIVPRAFAGWLATQPGREADTEQVYRDANATGDLMVLRAFAGWLGTQPGREVEIEQIFRDAINAGRFNALGLFVYWLETQPGREAEIEQIYRDAINAGRSAQMLSFAGWLATQPGREAETESAYRDAVTAGCWDALRQFGEWLGAQPGRKRDAEQIARFGLIC
ncbi:helix-turn-helix domain-containing protein [Amycolatopsis sp. lyj-112]|uniref:helix-turn-helix domain-containing protein n=1 Tax=Amycolatopsis sp. lyj-112 TaxID=2789288 RepID=UPI00397BB638